MTIHGFYKGRRMATWYWCDGCKAEIEGDVFEARDAVTQLVRCPTCKGGQNETQTQS